MSEKKIRAAIKSLESSWKPFGVELDAHYDPLAKSVHVARIEVEKGSRRKGIGSSAMRSVVSLADQHGIQATLSPSTDFGGTSVARLQKFYRRFGFVSNKGRHKDFTLSATMYRRRP